MTPKEPQDIAKMGPRWLHDGFGKFVFRRPQRGVCTCVKLLRLQRFCRAIAEQFYASAESSLMSTKIGLPKPQDGPKMAPEWPQDGPKMAQGAPENHQSKAFDIKVPRLRCVSPPRGLKRCPLRAFLGSSWGALERSWTRLGPLSGLSCGSPGLS